MSVYGYMRVSTDDQVHDLQKDALLASGIAPENIFEDTISGSKLQRPGLKALLARLEPGDTFTVWKLDRMGRSLADLIRMINDFHKKGVHFKSLTEAIDTTTPMGECMFHIVGAFAHLERRVISERTKEALKAAAKRGKRLGRPSISKAKTNEILRLARDTKLSVRKIAQRTYTPPAVVQRVIMPYREEFGRETKWRGGPRSVPPRSCPFL